MISILLCTYNGENYLIDQIESLLNQTYKDIRIYIHDDGSSDHTKEIINLYVQKESIIDYLADDTNNRGAKYSFMWLLQHVESEYYMFCDQDDVWFPNKIESMLSLMNTLEIKYKDKPILVHSDMKIVDKDLNILSESLYRTMKINPYIVHNINIMGVCSCGPGCSMLFNHLSKQCALDYPNLNNICMHDWWVAYNTVKNNGIIRFLDLPTMFYRQHSNNTVGASNVTLMYMLSKISNYKQTFSNYSEQMLWLTKVEYGGKAKFYFYKILYSIIRLIIRF